MCLTPYFIIQMSNTTAYEHLSSEEERNEEIDDSLLDPSLARTENGALATSLEGMTTVVRKDLTGLSLMGAAITSGIDSENELWGRLLGALLYLFLLVLPLLLTLTNSFFLITAINTYGVRNVSREQLGVIMETIMHNLSNIHARGLFYRLIAYNRDLSDGKGERTVTYMLLGAIVELGYGHEVIELLKLFTSVGFGFWGDVINLHLHLGKANSSVLLEGLWIEEKKQIMQKALIKMIVNQLRNDQRLVIQYQKMLVNDPTLKAPSISLAAKWVPSEGKKHDAIAKEIAFAMFPLKYGFTGAVLDGLLPKYVIGDVLESSEKASLIKFRKLVTSLRTVLNLVETKMSANQWGDIEPSAIPAKTMKKNRKVFMNAKGKPDAGRVLLAEKLTLLLSGKTDKTIKTKGLQFYELITPYVNGGGIDEVIEAQAKTIIKDMKALVDNGSFPLSVALCDVSGSMSGVPMIVSIALGIILANVMPAPWAGRVITFESNPRWVSLNVNSSIYQQVRVLKEAPWGGSTNFTAAMKLVLSGALASEDPRKSLPEFFFCFTDMQFDQASERNTFVIDDIKRKFQNNGLVMPKLIVWNLRASGTNTFAADKDTPGVGILSGFSQSAFKSFMGGCNFELLTPIYLLKETLNVARYDAVANCAK